MTGSDFNLWPNGEWLWLLLVACATVGAVTIIIGLACGVV